MTSDRSRLHFYFPNKCGGRAWPRRRHLHKSWSAEQCGLLAANRNTIYHCRRIKIHTRPLHEGWETMSSPLIKARWILQFMASLLLLASVRHRGQKGRVPTVCVMWVQPGVISQRVMKGSGSAYWSAEAWRWLDEVPPAAATQWITSGASRFKDVSQRTWTISPHLGCHFFLVIFFNFSSADQLKAGRVFRWNNKLKATLEKLK